VIWDFHVRDDRHHADAKVTLYDIFAESQPVTVLLNDDKALTNRKKYGGLYSRSSTRKGGGVQISPVENKGWADGTPPLFVELTSMWPAPAWIGRRYTRCARSGSLIMRATALGLIYHHFEPLGDEMRTRYRRAQGAEAESRPPERVYKIAKTLSVPLQRRLAREILAELRRMWETLDGMKDSSDAELLAFTLRREYLHLACMPLITARRFLRVGSPLRTFDAWASNRLGPLIDRRTTTDELLLSARRRFPRHWWVK
jgi:hypothetical protein